MTTRSPRSRTAPAPATGDAVAADDPADAAPRPVAAVLAPWSAWLDVLEECQLLQLQVMHNRTTRVHALLRRLHDPDAADATEARAWQELAELEWALAVREAQQWWDIAGFGWARAGATLADPWRGLAARAD